MWRWLCGLVLCTFSPTVQLQADPFLYFTNSTSNTVSVVDARSLTVVGEIAVGKEPFGLAFSPDGRRVFVANAQSREVSVIDATHHRLIQSIALTSELPVWVAVAPDGTYVYVTNEGSHDVTVISTASNRVVGRIAVGRGPAGIVVSPDSRYAYVANEGTNDVSLVDLQGERAVTAVPVGKVPQGIAMSPDGARVYVANFASNSVSVVATDKNQVIADVPVGEGPVALAVSPDGRLLCTGNFKAGSLSLVNTVEGREIATVATGAETFGVAISPSGREAYVASSKGRQVVVVDLLTRAITQRATLGEGPFKLAVAPDAHFAIRWEHVGMMLFIVLLAALILFCIEHRESPAGILKWQLTAVFMFALIVRCAGLNWGIPTYDAETAKQAPELRVSFHPDEDNFLWNLVRVRPRQLDFAVSDFHWGTLQYYLIEAALLIAQLLHVVATPWRESFLSFHPIEYSRIFVTGRTVSALLGSASIFLAFGIGRRLYNSSVGLISALVLALMPLHVVKSHDLTPDVTMMFFVLLAFWRMLIALDRPSAPNLLLAGVAAGLGVAAKYNAIFLLPACMVAFSLSPRSGWRKVWFCPGILLGFFVGEPYALAHHRQFWESVKPYLQFANLPEGAVPPMPTLLGQQMRSLGIFGLGIPLSAVLLAAALKAPLHRLSFEKSGRSSEPLGRGAMEEAFAGPQGGHLLWVLAVILFASSLVVLRYPLIRYTLPIAALLVFPAARFLWTMSRKSVGRWVGVLTLFLTGGITLLQVRILMQPHTANQAFAWIERHIPAGTSIQKGWPELPPLNPNKFRVTSFFAQPHMADFRKYFVDEGGNPRLPEYVVLDNLPTLEIPEVFLNQLRNQYNLVAKFHQRPRLLSFELPERDSPHDWKYTHPEIDIYRRK